MNKSGQKLLKMVSEYKYKVLWEREFSVYLLVNKVIVNLFFFATKLTCIFDFQTEPFPNFAIMFILLIGESCWVQHRLDLEEKINKRLRIHCILAIQIHYVDQPTLNVLKAISR